MSPDIVKCPWGSKLPPLRTTASDKAPDFSPPWLRPLSLQTLTLPHGVVWGLDIADAEPPGCPRRLARCQVVEQEQVPSVQPSVASQ